MNINQSICCIIVLCCFFSSVFATPDYSKIEEQILLNPPGSGMTSDGVTIYSRVRNKTIHKAMDTQFDRIETMMFVNSVNESISDELSYDDDTDCD